MNKQQERRSPLYFLDQSLQCLLPLHFLLDQMVVLSVCLHLAQLDVLHPNARLMQAQWLMRDTQKWRHCLNMSATADGHWYPQLRRHQKSVIFPSSLEILVNIKRWFLCRHLVVVQCICVYFVVWLMWWYKASP